ncbi:unnamed protein product [Calypogeia fissa]
MEKISVAIRVKPPSKAGSPLPFVKGHKWSVGPHHVSLYSTLGTPVNGQNYSFDHVFGTDAKNGDVYDGLAKGVIMSSLDGFNGTVFAYGQTSSGKTYTMKGTPTDPGIIRLAVHDVFGHIRQMTDNREFLIRVSYMEIYNEEINDLFAPENRRLRIHENLEKGIFVAGLREEIVDSPEQVFNLLEFGENHRHFGETNMNLYSSRSHTIFRMVIESRDASQDGCEPDVACDAVRVSCLNMVDLAGSERIMKTGAGGVRLKEGTHINKSLLTLGTVINKLSDGTGKQGGHIPYRDSKLTRILQPALGGNAKTAMICTITPDEIHIDETRGTLQFASRAKRVSTCAQVNEIVTDAALLKRQTKEIEDLRMKLQGMPQSGHLEKEILTLRNELLKFELEKERLYLELQEEKKAQVAREHRIKEQEQKIENLSTLFRSSNLDDRDADKFQRKVNRRETWCPRPYNSEVVVKDFRKSLDETEDDETIDNILYSMRRDRNHTLPPAFEIDEEPDTLWPDSNDVEEAEPPSDFGNIADEDTWMSLNRGHTTRSTLFPAGLSERAALSIEDGAAQKAVLLESQLIDLQARYTELESSRDVKIEEVTGELNDELNKVKRHLGKVQIENLNLKNELLAQLEMHRELQYLLEDLEVEMNAARVQTGSMQGILTESLHVQSEVLVSVKDHVTVSSTMGKYTSSLNLRPEVTEERQSVENSVEQCRKICEEAQNILRGRLSSIQCFIPQISTGIQGTSTKLPNSGETTDTVRHITDTAAVNDAPESTRTLCAPGEGNYCEGCMSSMLPTLSESYPELSAVHPTCKEISAIHTSGVIISSEQDDSNNGTGTDSSLVHPLDLVYDSECSVPNGLKAHALRALALHTDEQGDLGTCQGRRCRDPIDLTGVSSGFPSCRHVGCSFGTLGANCDICGTHEKAIGGKNEIPREMRKLCSTILDLFEPSFDPMGSARLRHSEEKDGQESGKLKTRLASAKLLATWLWEEVEAIVRHDVECLSCHVRERGHVGILLESLQVLLLRIGNLAIALLQATCKDEELMNDLRLELSKLKGFTKSTQYISKEGREQAGSLSGTVQQGQTTLRTVQQPIYEDRVDTVVQVIEGIGEDASDFITDRVLKVEGVEEVLGGVLQNSTVCLNKEHQVMKGEPLSSVLTSSGQASPGDEANTICNEESGNTNVLETGSATTMNSHNTPKGSNLLYPETSQQIILCGRQENQSNFATEESTDSNAEGDCSSCRPESQQVATVSVEPTGEGSLAASSYSRSVGAGGLHANMFTHPSVDFSLKEDNSVLAKNHGHAVEETGYPGHQSFVAQLLFKSDRIRQLEIKLADAELEIVELKIELEALRVEMQAYGDISQNKSVQQMQLELQAYKDKCQNYEEEMRLVIEQFPSSAENLQRERQLVEVMEENQFLQDCLAKAKKHVLRSKAWRDELRKWKDIENTRRDASSELQGISVRDSITSFTDTVLENKGGVVKVQVELPQYVHRNEGK